MKGLAVLMCAVLLLPGLVGCSCSPITVLDQDQPLIGAGEQAMATGQTCIRGMVGMDQLHWYDRRGKLYDAKKVLTECQAYLRRLNVWEAFCQPTPTTMPALITKGKYIVCLNPVVVLGPVYRQVGTYHFSDRYFQLRTGPNAEEESNGRWLALPEYFFVGTHLPYQDDLQWFSPDLKIGPRPLSQMRTGEGEYLIPVPWGALRLRRQDGELIVTGEAGKENQ